MQPSRFKQRGEDTASARTWNQRIPNFVHPGHERQVRFKSLSRQRELQLGVRCQALSPPFFGPHTLRTSSLRMGMRTDRPLAASHPSRATTVASPFQPVYQTRSGMEACEVRAIDRYRSSNGGPSAGRKQVADLGALDAARHSPRVSGGGVSGVRNAKCPISHMRNAKCPGGGTAECLACAVRTQMPDPEGQRVRCGARCVARKCAYCQTLQRN